MQRRHRGQARQFVDGLVSQPYRRRKMRSAMHDAMSDRSEPAAPGVLVGPTQDIVQNVLLLAGLRPVAVKDEFAMHVLDGEVGLVADIRDLACKQVGGRRTGHAEQTELDAGGSGVQREHCFRHRRGPRLAACCSRKEPGC
jgi:hypothetical protein